MNQSFISSENSSKSKASKKLSIFKKDLFRNGNSGSQNQRFRSEYDLNYTNDLSLNSLTPVSRGTSLMHRRRGLVEKKSLTIDEAFDRAGGFGN